MNQKSSVAQTLKFVRGALMADNRRLSRQRFFNDEQTASKWKIINYSYPWHREQAKAAVEGRKNRSCAIILTRKD